MTLKEMDILFWPKCSGWPVSVCVKPDGPSLQLHPYPMTLQFLSQEVESVPHTQPCNRIQQKRWCASSQQSLPLACPHCHCMRTSLVSILVDERTQWSCYSHPDSPSHTTQQPVNPIRKEVQLESEESPQPDQLTLTSQELNKCLLLKGLWLPRPVIVAQDN